MKKGFSVGYVVISLLIMGGLYSQQINNQNTISKLESKIEYISEMDHKKYEDFNSYKKDIDIFNTSKVSNEQESQTLTNYVEVLETKAVEKAPEIKIQKTVYLTNTGAKYHRSGCRYLKNSCTAVSLDQALSMGKTPCSVCKP